MKEEKECHHIEHSKVIEHDEEGMPIYQCEKCGLVYSLKKKDKKKVADKFDEIADLPLEKAKEILDNLFEDETWTNEEYNDLAELFTLHKILLDKGKEVGRVKW